MRPFRSALVCCFILAVFLGVAVAQEFRGNIRGAVRDEDGGVIPGVTVTLINEATSASRVTVTNERGNYVFAAVPPATYTLRAELPGFAPYNATDIDLGVNRSLVMDVNLSVGGIEETITVTGETPLIETANASVASALDRAQIETLPTPGRNIFIMAVTTPNVVHTGDPVFVRQQDQTNSSLLSLGGGPLRGNNYTLDGVALTELTNRAVIIPVFQAVEEMKVQVNTYDASMGRTGGGVFNTIHRSGTNSFAGTALYQTRPSFGTEKMFFTELAGNPKPEAPYHLYGGAFGGPIIRDKAFFWFAMEGYNATDLRNDSVILPTAAQANGDFSGLRPIYDPLNLDANGNRKQFPGNIIPADRMDPAGLSFAQTLASMGCSGVCSATASLANLANQYSFNINSSITDSWQLSGTYAHYWSDEPADDYYADLLGEAPQSVLFSTGSTVLVRSVDALAINSTHIPSDTSALTLRFGYTSFYDTNTNPDFTEDDARALGFTGPWLDQITVSQYPYIGADDYGDGDAAFGGWSSNPRTWWSREVSGTYTQFVGSHTIKFGGQWRRIGVDTFAPDRGFNFSFSKDFTQGPDPRNPDAGSGDTLANMLLGLPDAGTATVATPNVLFVDYFGGFIQDDWRMSDKLMLNMGLRLEHETGLMEQNDNFTVGFFRDEPFPVQVGAPAGLGSAPGFPLRGGLMHPGGGNNNYQWDPEAIKLGPRIGFAYTLDPNTSIRGGFGIFWAPYAVQSASSTHIGTIGFTAKTSFVDSNDGITPVSDGAGTPGSLSNPWPNGVNEPVGSSLGQLTNAGDSFSFNDQFKESPYITKWSIDYQHEFENHVAFKVGYVGSKGSNLGIGGTMSTRTNVNQLDSQFLNLGSALDDPLPNPFFGDERFGGLSGSPTLPRGQLLRPYPQFRDVLARHVSSGRSTYNALRVELEKRFRGNWGARVNYTYSIQKDNIYESNTLLEDEESMVFIVGREDSDFGYSRINSPHILNLNGLYRFPSPEGGAGVILGGWSASLSTLMRSGFPLAIKQSSNNLGSTYGFDHQRPNSTGTDPSVSGNTEELVAAGDPIVNPAAFTNAAAFTPGNLPQTITTTRTPKLINWDVSFEKITDIGRTNFSLRFEWINIFNGVNWRGPKSVYGSSSFGTITGVRGFPRTLQFMAKFNF